MPGEGLALNAKNLSKAFGATKALVDANFAVETGTAHALLGENGAGKSTTIKILSGILRPTEARSGFAAKKWSFTNRVTLIAMDSRPHSRSSRSRRT